MKCIYLLEKFFLLRKIMKSISESGYNYLSVGSGQPILILHGLMGGLSNFDGVFKYFPNQGYQVIAPELPIYNSSLLNTNVKFFAKFVYKFIKFKNLKDVIILGNSLGGHVGLIFSKLYPTDQGSSLNWKFWFVRKFNGRFISKKRGLQLY